MKRVFIISIISLFALNVFSQTDTINVNKERRNTNIYIPQLGITKISVVLDILNQNSSLLESSYIQINDENGNSIFGQNGYEALKDISTTYNKNNSLSDKGVKVLMALVEKVQKYGILHVETEYPSIEKSYSDMVKYQKSASNSLKVMATISVISLITSIISLAIVAK
ncbi:MAG: hypothetical protein WC679_04570 [Bacteroidales bacterium]|jgi:hypothetical protein